ncbi:MAG: hypothetical protein H7841_01740 [Magnetospirillum sp. WYHS-4]
MASSLNALGNKTVDDYYAQRGLTRPDAKKKATDSKAKAATKTAPAEPQRPAPREALQGAVAKAGQKTQDVLAKADEKLTQEIKTAAERGDTRKAKELTEKQAELRSVIETTKKSSAQQSATLKDKLEVSATQAADTKALDKASQEKATTKAAVTDQLAAARAAAAEGDRVVQALAAQNAQTRNARRGSLFDFSA